MKGDEGGKDKHPNGRNPVSDILRFPGDSVEETGYWSLEGPNFWGDYGQFLAGGMLVEPALERVGPFCPPISLSVNCLIATSQFAEKLAQRFPEVELVPVVKEKIVDIRWETWDRTSPQPPLLPSTGEPEDYVNLGQHSESASAEMGDVYQVVPPHGGVARLLGELGSSYVTLDRNCLPEYEFFRVDLGHPTFQFHIVTDESRCWLENEAPGWLTYRVARFE